MSANKSEPRYPLVVAVSLLSLYYLYLFFYKLIPLGHDGFQYFSLQYAYLNHAATEGQIPVWNPFMTHGVISNWWYFIQASPVQSLGLLVAPLFKGWSFYPIYLLGFFVDELFFILGSWLYARRFLSPSAVLFVLITIIGTTQWFAQPWFIFKAVYLLPLHWHLFHRYLETRDLKFIWFLLSLFVLMALGSLPYLIMLEAVMLLTYMVVFLLVTRTRPPLPLRSNIRSVWTWAAIVTSPILVAALGIILKNGIDSLDVLGGGRDASGGVSAKNFLDHAFIAAKWQWGELLWASGSQDYTVYFGYVAEALALVGLTQFWRNRYAQALFVFFVVTAMFSGHTWVSSAYYYVFYAVLKYFRHISLAICLPKLALCFLAGFGFEVLVKNWDVVLGRRIKTALAVIFTFAGVILLWRSLPASLIGDRLFGLSTVTSFPFRYRMHAAPWGWLFASTAFGTGLLFLVFRFARVSPRGGVISLLVFQAATLSFFRWHQTGPRSVSADSAKMQALILTPIHYLPKRLKSYDTSEPRFAPFLPQLGLTVDGPIGSSYWSNDAFFFQDVLSSTYRTDFLPKSIGEYVRLCSDKPYAITTPCPQFRFPIESALCRELSGADLPKLLVFEGAKGYRSGSELVEPFKGATLRELLVSSSEAITGPSKLLSLQPKVLSQGADFIEVEVSTSGLAHPWLYRSETWHPFWKAKVDGQPARLLRAWEGYQAVELVPDKKQKVVLSFEAPWIRFSFLVFGLNALAWLVFLFFSFVTCLRDSLTRGARTT